MGRRDFQVVPLKGLPIVALVFVVLIAAIAANEFWPLEFLHVAFGAAWTIVDLFMGFVIGPIMRQMSPAARIELMTRLMPKSLVGAMFRFMLRKQLKIQLPLAAAG